MNVRLWMGSLAAVTALCGAADVGSVVAATGSPLMKPSALASAVLAAEKGGKSAGPSAPPTVDLSASAPSVLEGGTVRLTWTATGATKCTASGDWTGKKSVSGTQTISGIAAPRTFALSCSSKLGSASKSVSVDVLSVTLRASPESSNVGDAVTLTWEAKGATYCEAEGGWSGEKAVTGSQTLVVRTPFERSYGLNCGSRRTEGIGFTKTVSVRGAYRACTHSSLGDGVLVTSLDELRSALSAAGGNGRDDVIYVASGAYLPSTPIVYDAKGTTEKVSLIGCGADGVFFDGGKTTRVFHFRKNGEIANWENWLDVAAQMYGPPNPQLRMAGLTVSGGSDAQEPWNAQMGAGVFVEGFAVELEDVVFAHNAGHRRAGGIGGATDISIKRSVFDRNDGMGMVGAVQAAGRMTIEDSIFENHDNNNGIAVLRSCYKDCPSLDVTIARSIFRRNRAHVLVDGETVGGSFSKATIVDSTFEDSRNHAVAFGQVGIVKISNSKFYRNRHRPKYLDDPNRSECTDYDFTCDWGGAISVGSFASVTIENSEFVENSAADYGGAIEIGGSQNCEAYSPPCDRSGVPTYFDYNLLLKNVVFKGNSSHRGAAVAVGRYYDPFSKAFQLGNIRIEGGQFVDNTGVRPVLPEGAKNRDETETSVIVAGGNIQICGTTFTGNSADTIVLAKGNYSSTGTCP